MGNQIWMNVLYQDELKAKWTEEDNSNQEALKMLSSNMMEFARGLMEFIGPKLNLDWNAAWEGMLSCYTGDRTYNCHLDNPNFKDNDNTLPDNGLRLTVAYFINPHWSPEGGYNG